MESLGHTYRSHSQSYLQVMIPAPLTQAVLLRNLVEVKLIAASTACGAMGVGKR